MKKTKRNNFGVKGFSKPHKSFFAELLRPVNKKLVKKCKIIFQGIAWGGGEFEYIPEDLENLTPQQLGFIQEMLLHFIYETERLKREKTRRFTNKNTRREYIKRGEE